MPRRKINRIAFLQEYRDCPLDLIPYVKEVGDKGYHSIAIAVSNSPTSLDAFTQLAAQARTYDLDVAAFTGYMKYQDRHLRENPSHRMVLSGAAAQDQDRVTVNWGCPFNPDFLARYLRFLRQLAAVDNLVEVWINDEASLGVTRTALGCYCPLCRAQWARDFDRPMPEPPFVDSQQRLDFTHWRFARWNAVHGQMRQAMNENRQVRAVFLTSPAHLFAHESWVGALDHATMLEQIDGLMTDPYYTFHVGSNNFLPAEVYLSECSRYLVSLCGPNKVAGICAQGFSHPTFTRPLDERDGYWSSVIPAALGIEEITSYTYLLQKSSAVQQPYEKCFQLDQYFNQLDPWRYVGVIDSSLSEICHDDPSDTWRQMYLLEAAECFRRCGISHTYLSAEKVSADDLATLGAVVLSGVSLLNGTLIDALKEYVRAGGCLIAFGPTGLSSEDGSVSDQQFMADLFGLKVGPVDQQFAELDSTGLDEILLTPIPPPQCHGFMGGTLVPAFVLHQTRAVNLVDDRTEVLTRFADSPSAPAVTVRPCGSGHCIYFAGTPSRIFRRPGSSYQTLNLIDTYICSVVKTHASAPPVFEPLDYPPRTLMMQNRPMDRRNTTTVEVLPMVGEDMLLAVVPSYFREAQSFKLRIRIPQPKKPTKVTELITDRAMRFDSPEPNQIIVPVDITEDDFLKVIAVFLG